MTRTRGFRRFAAPVTAVGRSARQVGLLLLAVAILAGGCGKNEDLGKRLGDFWKPVSQTAQRIRSAHENLEAVRGIVRVDVAATLLQRDLDYLVADLLKQFAEDQKKLTAAGKPQPFSLSRGKVLLKPQGVEIVADFVYDGPEARIEGTTTAFTTLATGPQQILVSARFEEIRIAKASLKGWLTFDMEPVVAAVNTGLRNGLEFLNRSANAIINPYAVPLAFKPFVDVNLKKKKTSGEAADDNPFMFESREIFWSPAFDRSAILIEEGKLHVLASLRNRTKEEAEAENERMERAAAERRRAFERNPLTAPKPILTEIAGAVSEEAFAKGHEALLIAFTSAVAEPMGDVWGGLTRDTSVALSKAFFAETLNGITSKDFCGSLHLKPRPTSYETAIKLAKAPERYNCSRDVGACQAKDTCSNREACRAIFVNELIPTKKTREIRETVCSAENEVCSGWAMVLLGPAACISTRTVCVAHKEITKIETYVENVLTPVTKEIDTPVCNALREIDRVTPGLCQRAGELQQLDCNILEEVKTAGCNINMEFLKTLEANPVGIVNGTFDAAVDGRMCATASVRPDMSRAEIRLKAEANADLRADTHFRWKTFPGLICTTNFDYDDLQTKATAAFSGPVGAGIGWRNDDKGNLVIMLSFDTTTVYVDTDPSPFSALFLRHPELMANCKILTAAGLGFIAWDTVVTNQVKAISPYASGKGIPIEVKDQALDIEVKAPRFGQRLLKGSLRPKSIVFEAMKEGS